MKGTIIAMVTLMYITAVILIDVNYTFFYIAVVLGIIDIALLIKFNNEHYEN